MTYAPTLTCPKCGGIVPETDVQSVQIECRSCKSLIEL